MGAVTVILTGPTASGKSALALSLASRYGRIEIINADSLLFYRGLDIGTAKPIPEDLKRIPHHLINIRDPDQPFTAGDFVRAVEALLVEIHGRGCRALIVGGTGFYLKALLYGLWSGEKADPALRQRLELLSNEKLYEKLLARDLGAAKRIGLADRYRLLRALELIELTGRSPTELQAEKTRESDPRFQLWIVDRLDPELRDRIAKRSRQMLEAGLIHEVKQIRERYPHCRPLRSVGYRQICDFLDGTAPQGRKKIMDQDGLVQEIELATRQLVKRQRTWFRGQAQDALRFELDRDYKLLEERFAGIYSEPVTFS